MAHRRGRVQAGRLVCAMTPLDAHTGKRWIPVVVAVAGAVVVAAFVVVFLVLTGIIAEPETVIEGVVRALLGQ